MRSIAHAVAVACLVALGLFSGPARTQAPLDDARLPDLAYPEVVRLWEAGRPVEALDALDRETGSGPEPGAGASDEPLEASLVRAALLGAAGRHAASADVWLSIRTRADGLSVLALTRAVEARLAGGDLDGSSRLLASFGAALDAEELAVLRLAVADAQVERRNWAAAEPLYRAVLARRNRSARSNTSAVFDEAALGLARTLEGQGNRREAQSLLRDLQRTFRSPDGFREATRRLAGLVESGVPPPDPLSGAEYRRLIVRLCDLSSFDQALTAIDDWQRTHPEDADRAELLAIDTLYRSRANEAARQRADAFLTRAPDAPNAHEAHVLRFRLDIREGDTQAVERRGRALWTGDVPGVSRADQLELGRLLGAYLVSVGEVARGLDVYREVFRQSSDAEFETDILWRAGVAAYRDGQLARADTNLEAVRRRAPGGELGALADYWSAAVAAARGRRAEAIAGWTRLVRQSPYAYYGLRAAERLAAIGAPAAELTPGLMFPAPTLSRAARDNASLRAAQWLARSGLLRDAADTAEQAATEVSRDPALGLLAARALARAGEYRRSTLIVESRFGRYLERPVDGRPSDLWTLAYPRAYWDDVARAAEASGVDPLILLAIARRESRYDPTARSPVGALGLFQLMPYTAASLGPTLQLDVSDRSALAAPDVSARLAAHLVATHGRVLDGRLVAIAAAYNAGEDRAAAWWQAAAGLPEDLFVDTIPYSETRIYVRRVYTNYVLYQRLYAAG